MKIKIGDYLLLQIRNYGIKQMFGVPGDYTLGFLDMVEEMTGLEWVGCCNELDAAYAADGYARINGMSAMCVTYGVGELSAVNGIAGAYAERVPVIVISGSPAAQAVKTRAFVHHTLGEGIFDTFREIFSKITCAQATIEVRYAQTQIDDILRRCFTEKLPVYIELGSDIAGIEIEVEAVVSPSLEMPASDENSLNDFIETVKSLLSSSKGEMIIADYEVNRYNLRDELNGFIAKARIPATTLNMGKSAINESSPYYVGVYVGKISDKAVTEAAMNSDIALVIGAKFTDGTTCFTDANPEIKYIHIHPFYCEAEGKIYDNIYMGDVIKKLSALSFKNSFAVPHQDHHPFVPEEKKLTQKRLYEAIEFHLREGNILIAETGTAFYGAFPIRLHKDSIFVGQPLWASIGYAMGATLGTSFAANYRRSYLIIGDGSFQLTAQTISTILHYKLNPVILLINNRGYTIEKAIHGRDKKYNDINMWKYSEIPKVLNTDDYASVCVKVNTEKELSKALALCNANPNKMIFIELIIDEFDIPVMLAEMAEEYSEEDKY